MNADLVSLLRKTVPFEGLPKEVLEKIVGKSELKTYRDHDIIYDVDEEASALFVIISGRVEHKLGPGAQATNLVKLVGPGDVIGWAALLKNQHVRLARTTAMGEVQVLRIDNKDLMDILSRDPALAAEVLARFATMVINDFTLPPWLAEIHEVAPESGASSQAQSAKLTGLSLTMYRISRWLQSPKPYLMMIGFATFLGSWWLLSEVLHFWRFDSIPGPVEVWEEWTSPNPIYGLSFYTPEYYTHIWVSVRRILQAFLIATLAGVPVGLFLGWSKKFREFVFPVFEMLRPIPILAWVPLAIIMFDGVETPVIFLTTLASFYATALNTMLGVESIDDSYPRAAACLGASKWQIFRHVIVPGALPHMFTGLQISVGVAWFSLVAAEMVSGQFGLGYVINTSYTMVQYPTIIIGMITLGFVGYVTSALVRIAGDHMMQWRVRELALGG